MAFYFFNALTQPIFQAMKIPNKQINNPLHGITLEVIIIDLVEKYGWDGLAEKIPVNCFIKDPSIKSSLKFLRTTPWARAKVESLYLEQM
jgi:uncharacterized protein (DUF2132 family)